MSATDRAFVGSIPEVYDRCLGPMLFEPYALDMAGRFKGFEGALLETAAGTGRVTRHLATAAPGAKITATDLNEPIATLPHTIFVYAISPYADWQSKAWATAFILISLVLLLNIVARVLVSWRTRRLGTMAR